MSLESEVARGGEAQRLMDSQMFKDMCANIQSQLSAQRRAVPLNATDTHTKLIITEQLWGKILDYFQEIADTGKFAAVQIANRPESPADFSRQFRR